MGMTPRAPLRECSYSSTHAPPVGHAALSWASKNQVDFLGGMRQRRAAHVSMTPRAPLAECSYRSTTLRRKMPRSNAARGHQEHACNQNSKHDLEAPQSANPVASKQTLLETPVVCKHCWLLWQKVQVQTGRGVPLSYAPVDCTLQPAS